MQMRWRTTTLFLLATLFASWAMVALPPAVARAQACTELVTNGGFETTGAWELGVSPVPPEYVTYTAHSGTHSLQLGITSGANVESFSSARQTVAIPAGASQVTLSFWFYAMAEAPASTDYMELALLSPDGSVILAKPWQSHNDSRVWNQMAFDLSAWKGQTFQLYFNVYNDGKGGKAAMFLDDVSLTTCPTTVTPGAATPTGTRTATRTHTPASSTVTPTPTPGCTELVRNGSFTNGLGDWEATGDPSGVALSSDPVHTAPYALKLGSLDVSLNGLAAARQLLTIPIGAPTVALDVWILTQSQPGAGADYQEIALLNSSGGLLYVPYRGPANDGAWVHLQFNLAAFAGQTVYLRFAVNNDGVGGRTVMYVDDVRMATCSSGASPTVAPTATRTPAPLPTWTPAPTWTPLPTYPTPVVPTPPNLPTAPAPNGCVELTQNGGFEGGFAGWTPGANPVPPALVTSPVFSGAYAAQLGSQTQNSNGYSSMRHAVTVPYGYSRTFISFWTYTWSEAPAGSIPDGEKQEFVLLGPGNVVWAVPWKVLENAQTWQQHIFEIVGVAGQSFDLYFAAVNDGAGGRTALYVDEVHLWGCSGDAWPALATSQGQPPAMAQTQAQGTLPQAVPVPQVYPVETLPAMVSPQQLAAAAPITQTQVQTQTEPLPLPAPQWTVVAIGTVGVSQPPEAMTAEAAVETAAPALQTAAPLLETPAAAVALLGTAAPETPIVTISTTPQPASFLSNLTARWPPNWPFILLGIIAVVAIVWLIIKFIGSGGLKWLLAVLGMLALVAIVILILRARGVL